MGGKEDKEKAEKIAAAKKRVAQLQKKKKAAATKSTKDDSKETEEKATVPAEEAEAGGPEPEPEPEAADVEARTETETKTETREETEAETKPDADADAVLDADDETLSPPKARRHSTRQPSVSLQSQLRSTSFRGTAPDLSPIGGGAGGSLVQLQRRIEELERNNQKLAEEAAQHEARWRKTEEELEEVREDAVVKSSNSTAATNAEISRLRAELDLLKRRNSHPHSHHGHSSPSDEVVDSLRKEVESKDSVIADMQLEISRLRSQLSHHASSSESLSAAEAKIADLETKLSETKQALTRASEKAVLDGTAHASKDTQIRALERDLETTKTQSTESAKKVEQLEKKIEVMNKLHRESEARSASKLSALEHTARDLPSLRAKLSTLEAENAKLREKAKRDGDQDHDAEGIDELEDEERNKLARRIRELEGQVFELQRAQWREKRSALQPEIDSSSLAATATASIPRTSFEVAGEGFDEVDLSGGTGLGHAHSSPHQKHSNLSQYISSGLHAFLPSTTSPPPVSQTTSRQRNDSLLQDLDDDVAFDEAAFAQAQREEEAKKMLLHVRQVKSGLKNWKGWRLDLVDLRRADAGTWPIFDV